MGLSARRKILSVIFTVVIAVSTMMIIFSMVISSTFMSISYIEKHFLTADIENVCDAQLTAEYEALEAESGIPSRVFLMVKDDYKIHDSLVRALQNVFGEEDESLYNESVVEYFEKLCTEFLKGSDLAYEKTEVRNVAEKATQIYCDVLGFHNTSHIAEKVLNTRKVCRALTLIFAVLLAAGAAMLAFLYTETVKAYSYVLVGIAAGGLGAMLCSGLCYVTHPASGVTVYPSVMNSALQSYSSKCFMIAMLVSFAVFVASYITFAIAYFKSHKK